MTVCHHGSGPLGDAVHQRFEGDGVPDRLACVNARCQRGGFRLREFIASMVAWRISSQTWSASCYGRQTEAGGSGDAPCPNYAEVKVAITYAKA